MEPICLIINKLKKNGSFIYYHVEDCLNKKIFYLGIDAQKKLVLYFDTDDFNKQVGEIDLTSNEAPSDIPGISSNIVLMLSAKILKAIKENNFPDNLRILLH